jgi:fatty-acyl-CoA synthase
MSGEIRYYDWLAHHADRRPDKLAVHELATGRTLTYAQLDERARRLASHLRSRGVGKGDRVALLAPNGAEYFDLEFACGKIGAIMVPLNWRLTVPELTYILGDSAPSALIFDRDFAASADELVREVGIPHALEVVAGEAGSTYERALRDADPNPDVALVHHHDVSTIMYTSGTTGHPKGALITHGMTFWNVVNLGVPARITPATVHLVFLPLFHTGGLNCYANPVLHAGGTLRIMRAFDAGQALAHIGDAQLGITHVFGVPAPYLFMQQHPSFAEVDLSRVQVAGVGGAPCPLPMLQTWAKRGVPLVQGYGMTETSPSTTMLDAEQAVRKVGSAGKPLLHTEVRVVDADGRPTQPGEVGELQTRGPHVTPGYWNRPDATAASFVDGWLKTGDAARLDEEGYIYIVDRWKDMYISGGENVYPAEVETVLHQLPEVAEAAIVGVPDERWGEVGAAYVVLRPGASLREAEVIGHCSRNLAKYKVPRSVTFIDVLPRNAAGKILKRELKAARIQGS